jgi:hypothetical protein
MFIFFLSFLQIYLKITATGLGIAYFPASFNTVILRGYDQDAVFLFRL